MIPHDLGGWLSLVLRLAIFLISPTWFAWRLSSSILAHSICLSGQRTRHKSLLWYRFAVQNNESVSLSGKRLLTVKILDEDGQFLSSAGEAPRLFVGRNPVLATLSRDLRELKLEFDELPAYDTWSIECHTNELARNLTMALEEVAAVAREKKPPAGEPDQPEPALSRRPVLSHSRLMLYGNQVSVFEGARATPELMFAAAAIGLFFAGYAVAVLFGYGQYTYWDIVSALLIVAFGFALWLVIRRPAPSISQGYWTATVVERTPEGRSNAASA